MITDDMERKITEELMAWKNDPNKTGLIIEGARQVGKTYIVREFGKSNYRYFQELNFHERQGFKQFFSENISADAIIQSLLSEFPGFKAVKGESLLFLDEIQDCPEALTAIKPLIEDGRLDIIASGSMLGIHYRAPRSYPVGYVHVIRMHPMTFEEYLWAIGIDRSVPNMIREHIRNKKPFGATILKVLNEHFRQYMQVGGMPRAVYAYTGTESDMSNVLSIQEDVIQAYRDDIAGYAPRKMVGDLLRTFDLIPTELSRESKRFRFVDLSGSNGRYASYKEPMDWISGSRFVNVCYCLRSIEHPLRGQICPSKFKTYTEDTGILMQMYGTESRKAILNADIAVNEGAIAENAVQQMLTSCGLDTYYFEKNEREGQDNADRVRMEIDFITSFDEYIAAFEVKSGKSRKAKSLNALRSTAYGKNVSRFIRLSFSDISVDESGVEHYPIFCAAFADSMFERTGFRKPKIDNSVLSGL